MKFKLHNWTKLNIQFRYADKPNMKITISEFSKLQCWKDENCIFPTYISVPKNE